MTKGGDGEDGDYGPFDDEETRAFYCDLPDFLTTIPPAALGMSVEAIEAKREENQKKYGSDDAEMDEGGDDDGVADITEEELEKGIGVEGEAAGEEAEGEFILFVCIVGVVSFGRLRSCPLADFCVLKTMQRRTRIPRTTTSLCC